MKWLRLYSDIIDDPKVLRVGAEIRWVYVGLLCISSRQNPAGSLPCVEDIAIHLRFSEAKTARFIDELVKVGLIDKSRDGKTLHVHGWDNRQYPSDNVTERTRKHKERAKSVAGNVPGTFPGTERERPRAEQKQNRGRTEQKPPTPKGGDAPPPVQDDPPEEESPEYPDPLTSMHIVMTGEHRMEEIDARKLWGHIWRAFRRKVLCYGFYEHQQWLTVEEWSYAIKTAVERGERPHSIRYLEKIGYDLEDGKAKQTRPVKRGEVGSVPYKPTSQQQPTSGGTNGSTNVLPPRVHDPGPSIPADEAYRIMTGKNRVNL